ncbi:hypothetical protein Ms3S1_36640 [Methylosinus sp. 3S-1]
MALAGAAAAARAATMALGERAALAETAGAGAAGLCAGEVLALIAFPGVVFATGMVSLEAGVETGVAAAALSFVSTPLGATDETAAGWTTDGVVELSRAGFVREPSSVAPGVAAAGS